MPAQVGALLGRYEILGVIGRGTMGAVYKARDPKIDREVAIKTISMVGQEGEEEEYRERFFQEARACGRMSHPGIVTIFDVGEEPETRDPYIVMEYVPGRSLDDYLGKDYSGNSAKHISLGTALLLVQEIAEALDYAHQHEVIHRDIKPANILITGDGHAKIADFGIAKLNRSQLTLPGQMIGSPAYMAPEQLCGDATDHRADLFSLGVIFYTMLAGHRPFQGNTTATVAFKLVNRDPVPVTSLRSDLPGDIDAIVVRAIAKDPEQRFQTGAEMAQTMETFRKTHQLLAGKLDLTGRPRSASSHHHLGYDENFSKGPGPQDWAKTLWSSARLPKAGQWDGRAITTFSLIALVIAALIGWYGKNDAALVMPSQFPASIAPPVESVSPPSTTSRDDRQISSPSVKSAGSIPAKRPSSDTPRKSVVQLPAAVPTTASAQPDQPASSPKTPKADLEVKIAHHFVDAEASIWLDRKLVYSHSLTGELKRHNLLFRGVSGWESQSLTVDSGQHELRVRVKSAADNYDRIQILNAKLSSQKSNILRVKCEHNALQINLE